MGGGDRVLAEGSRAAQFVPPLLVAVWLGGPWVMLLVGLAVVLAGIEAFRLLTAAGLASMPKLGIVLAVVIALGDSVKELPGGSGLLLAALGIVLVGTGALTRLDPREGLAIFATTTFGAMYVGLLGFIVRLGASDAPVDPAAVLGWLGPDRAWILALVFIVWAFDTARVRHGPALREAPVHAAHLAIEDPRGSHRGIRRGRSRRGLLVAMVGRPWLAGVGLGLVLAAAAQAGDLAESMLKRAAGAKESGTLIPGHGGMLDRVNSFLFAAPVAYFYVVSILG